MLCELWGAELSIITNVMFPLPKFQNMSVEVFKSSSKMQKQSQEHENDNVITIINQIFDIQVTMHHDKFL